MKFIYYSFLIILLVVLPSACVGDKQPKKGTPFIVEGFIENADGKKLALYIPSQNLDNRIISPVERGKFYFKGQIKFPEVAYIITEDENTPEGMFSMTELVIAEEDTIKVHLKLEGNSDFQFLSHDTIVKSEINTYFRKKHREFWSVLGGVLISGRKELRDSLEQYVYPGVRDRVLKKYDEIFVQEEYPIVQLYFLRQIIDQGSDIFIPAQLSQNETNFLKEKFEGIPSELSGTPDYEIVQSILSSFDNPTLVFKDFILEDPLGAKKALSDIIKENKYTVLDFWWAGCVPCRKFNQENGDAYEVVKDKGIEIVGINVDSGKKVWKNASKKDGIPWINLYAGFTSTIQEDYRIKAFPTKIIVDRNFNFVPFEFKNAEELLKLVE